MLPCQDIYYSGDVNWFSLFPETQILSEVLKKEIMHDIEEIPPLDRFSPFREAHCHTACRVTVVLGSPAAPMHKAPAGVTPRSCRSCVQPLLFSTCSSLYTSPRPALEIQIQHLVVPVHYVLGFRIDLLATAFFTAWQTVTSPCRPQLSAFLASLCVIK